MPRSGASRPLTPSVSAGIAAASAHLPLPSQMGLHFPGEDGGRSLAEMAHRDLDAALQLLAERAQYITDASGAAIALRRGEHNDMLCRASTGSNAPELGSLLSMEYGLSGECVRTRQPLRCDDAERDPRVNHEVCRQLGIASVVLMPIVSDQQVLGVFEIFSGKPRAFEPRDVSALQRLSEMVETAVRHAVAVQPAAVRHEAAQNAEAIPEQMQLGQANDAPGPAVLVEDVADAKAPETVVASVSASVLKDDPLPEGAIMDSVPAAAENTPAEEAKAATSPKKPLFWSAMHVQNSAAAAGAVETIDVPPVLRNLKKCQSCGFPVSQERTFCVECEEKQWGDQSLRRPHAGNERSESPHSPVVEAAKSEDEREQSQFAPAMEIVARESAPDIARTTGVSDEPTLFLSSAAPKESWLAANKYVLGALLVAVLIAVILWLR